MNKSLGYLSLGFCFAALLIGCSDDPPITGAGNVVHFSKPQAEIRLASEGRQSRDVEDDILRMERNVPGLGGVYLENGEIVVYVPEPTNRAETLRGLALSSPFLSLDPAMRHRLAVGDGVQLRKGSFAFSQLVAWQEDIGRVLRPLGIVSYTDADEARNQVTVGVSDPQRVGDVVNAALTIGVPIAALNVEAHPFEKPLSTLRDQFSQVPSGMQIMNPNGQVCTIGWNVHRGDDAPDGEEGFFTAGHCASAAQPGSGVTGPMYQATTTRRIGYITQDSAWNETDANCDYSYCTQVDAMYVKYDDPANSLGGQLAQPTSAGTSNSTGSISANNVWTNLNGSTSTFLVGSTVDKIGRTTGWTRGTLQSTCAKVNVPASPSSYTVLCANKVQNAAVGEGDSGGPVFQIADSTGSIVKRGILFSGGSTTNSYSNNSEGLQYCTAACVYSYSTWTRINLYLPQPPF